MESASGLAFNDTNYNYSNANAGNSSQLCSNNSKTEALPLGKKQKLQKVLVGKTKTPTRKSKNYEKNR